MHSTREAYEAFSFYCEDIVAGSMLWDSWEALGRSTPWQLCGCFLYPACTFLFLLLVLIFLSCHAWRVLSQAVLPTSPMSLWAGEIGQAATLLGDCI